MNTIEKLKTIQDFKLLSTKSDIINLDQAFLLEDHLPSVFQGIPWVLFYSWIRDGTSYNTYYKKTLEKFTQKRGLSNPDQKFRGWEIRRTFHPQSWI